MKVGVNVAVNSETGDIGAFAKKAEDLGFQSLWMAEHPIIPVHTTSKYGGTPDGSIPDSMSDMADPFIGLAIASATTSKIMLGTSICLIPEHNPLVQAKQIAALDFHSGGRFIFGIGTGWLREETEIMGGDFDHRWTQAREAVEAMKELWTKEDPSYQGKYHSFSGMKFTPKPVQKPHIPIIIGGTSKAAIRRAARSGAAWHPTALSPEVLAQGMEYLKEQAVTAGRDPSEVEVSVSAAIGSTHNHNRYSLGEDPEEVLERAQKYQEMGVGRLVVSPNTRDQSQLRPIMEMIAEVVIPAVQS